MKTLLYDELVPWYRLLDPLEDHREEGGFFGEALQKAVDGPSRTLLELGAGAGNTAHFLRDRFSVVVTDLSTQMLALSAEINPDCEHRKGDMRTIRLQRQFDAVFVHDAVCYLLTESDLAALAHTVFVHTRPGGAAIIVPDYVGRNGFHDTTALHEGADGDRVLKCVEWTRDPDPSDSSYLVDFAFLLGDANGVIARHDRHVFGLFEEDTWMKVLSKTGFRVETIPRPDAAEPYADFAFLCRRDPS